MASIRDRWGSLALALVTAMVMAVLPASAGTPQDQCLSPTRGGPPRAFRRGMVRGIAQIRRLPVAWHGHGAVRFDGVRFSNGPRSAPRSCRTSIRTLRSHDGSMWVGFSSLQGASRAGGQVRTSAQDGLPATDIAGSRRRGCANLAGGSAGLSATAAPAGKPGSRIAACRRGPLYRWRRSDRWSHRRHGERRPETSGREFEPVESGSQVRLPISRVCSAATRARSSKIRTVCLATIRSTDSVG